MEPVDFRNFFFIHLYYFFNFVRLTMKIRGMALLFSWEAVMDTDWSK